VIKSIVVALTFGIAASTAGAAAPFARNGLIAIASDRAENYPKPAIYVVRPPSGARVNVSRQMAYGAAAWSPDGKALVFPGEQDHFVIRADGSPLMQLRVGKWSGGRSDLAWSPKGNRIAIANHGDDRLYVERLGRRPRAIVHEWTRFPSWSPNGRLIAFVVDDVAPNGTTLPPKLFVVEPNGRRLRKLSRWSTGADTGPSWSPSGRRLALALRGYIRTIDIRTGDTRLVTRVKRARDPVWSPKGKWIAFERLSSAGTVDIYIVRPSGTGLRRLVQTGARRTSVAWSPDGASLAYVDQRGVYVLDLRNGETRLVDDHSCREQASWLAWSPRGGRIAFASVLVQNDTEIFTTAPTGGPVRQLTDNCFDDREPAWSPNGKELAFARVEQMRSDLYLMRRNGSSERRLTTSPTSDRHPTWAPDGENLTFSRIVGVSPQLFTVRRDGSELRQITASPGSNVAPVWSPRGDSIVFASTRDDPARGTSQIYVTRPDGADQRRVTAEQYGAIEPDWSPDRSWIVFVQQQDWASGLIAIRPDGVERRRLISRSIFTPTLYRRPDWSPDGTWIAFSTEADILLLPTGGGPVRAVEPVAHPVRNLDPDWQPLP
jgi:Tol biopolymer transport system component